MNQKRKKIIVFSGLGADYRVFQHLKLQHCELQHVEWIMPHPSEDLSTYARRIARVIDDENPILMGLSFGGMVAQEVAKFIPYKQLILISSAKSKKEIPKLYRFFVRCKLHRLLKWSFLRKGNWLTFWFFSCKSDADKALLRPILEESDPDFLVWAVGQIAHFDQESTFKNSWHIHGDSDHVLPLKNIHCDYVVKGGGHFMVFNRAEEVSQGINNFIARSETEEK